MVAPKKSPSELKSLTELFETRAEETPDSPAVYTGHPDFGLEWKCLTYGMQLRAIDRLCRYYAHLQPSCPPGEVPPERVIGILNLTAWDMTLLEMALMKLGLCPLMLSINNSAPAIANLCKITKATHLLYGPRFEETVKQAQAQLKEEGYTLELEEEKRFPVWGPGGVDDEEIEPCQPRLTPDQEHERTALILHSSGSTGFPKPNYCTHKSMLALMTGGAAEYPSFSALPLYHGFGHHSGLRCMYFGVPFTLFFPHLPLTAANITRCWKTSTMPQMKETQLAAVPYVLKLLAETEEGIQMLASFSCISFAGAAVPDDLGDRLVSRGCNLYSVFGLTETGPLMNSRRDFKNDKAWNWVRPHGKFKAWVMMEPRGGDTYECVCSPQCPALIAHNRPDGSYASKDLFQRHPEHDDWYRYIGRLDDTLTQTLGEKTNPVPIELAIRGNSPYIRECIVFGDRRPQIGCLIRPSEMARDIYKDRSKYMQLIWPVIEQANAEAPSHSRILPEMVEILDIDTKIPVATKMSILRPACYKLFAPIIDAVYDRFELGSGGPKLDITDKAAMEKFISETVNSTLKEQKSAITPDTDLFAYGVDSLQATRIRNVLSQRLELGDKNLGQNVVYEHPSVSKLADYLLEVKLGSGGEKTDEQQHEVMLKMLDKWSATLDKSQGKVKETSQGEVVVLTGATGSLGAYILDQLTSDPSVSRVICLSRATSHPQSVSRIHESLQNRRRVLSPNSAAKITSYASDVNVPNLGLSEAEYTDLVNSATVVIHNAWPVNFVLSIESFETHIGGASNLMNLATKAGARFFFSSSVATRNGVWEDPCPENFPQDPKTAGSMGYGRSKWVVEKMCERAGKSGAPVGVLRIGQLVGDTENGVFNETEAWPLMFKSANVVGTLPELQEPMSWLPVDLAARAIRDLVLSPLPTSSAMYHVLNPTLTSWSTILHGLEQGGLKFTPTERRHWLQEVKGNTDPMVNPAIKLVDFYTGRLGGEAERKSMKFDVKHTGEVSPTIRDCKAVEAGNVAKWVKHWKETGFLQ